METDNVFSTVPPFNCHRQTNSKLITYGSHSMARCIRLEDFAFILRTTNPYADTMYVICMSYCVAALLHKSLALAAISC